MRAFFILEFTLAVPAPWADDLEGQLDTYLNYIPGLTYLLILLFRHRKQQ